MFSFILKLKCKKPRLKQQLKHVSVFIALGLKIQCALVYRDRINKMENSKTEIRFKPSTCTTDPGFYRLSDAGCLLGRSIAPNQGHKLPILCWRKSSLPYTGKSPFCWIDTKQGENFLPKSPSSKLLMFLSQGALLPWRIASYSLSMPSSIPSTFFKHTIP